VAGESDHRDPHREHRIAITLVIAVQRMRFFRSL
jgi:hypothetical protein